MSSNPTDLSWLPTDSEEQLALGFRIISNAYKGRVNAQDTEIRALKAQNVEKTEQMAQTQKKLSTLEVQLFESTQRGNQLAEENKQLIANTRKLQKDIQRLECLKKAVLTSIQENHGEDDSNKYYTTEDILQSVAPRTMQEINSNDDLNNSFLSKLGGNVENINSPHHQSYSGTSDGRTVDGKAFFRNARNRLSYENFNAFLANIKKLNNHLLSREETLVSAQQLFGDNNQDLYEEFKLLLLRHS